MDELIMIGFVESLKNDDFSLESKMDEIKIQNNQIKQMLCENFILPGKWMHNKFNRTVTRVLKV